MEETFPCSPSKSPSGLLAMPSLRFIGASARAPRPQPRVIALRRLPASVRGTNYLRHVS